jgi:hypothetical protein
VRSFVHRTIVLALVTTLIAGCDGGGTSTSPVPRSGSPSQSQAVGRGTLTIVFPANFHRATRAASTTRAAAAVRKPVYVNPTNTNILDIYVDGTLQTNLDGNTPNDSATISNTDSSGTQTLNIPLYSTATNDIAVVEYDADKANVLAVGENPATPQFSPGTSPQISVSLLMNVQGIAIASSSSGGSASQLSPNGNNEFDICPSNTLSNTFFLFATDADDGFVATPGSGSPTTTGSYAGTVQPTILSSSPDSSSPPTTAIEPYNGGYAVSFGNNSGIEITPIVPNNPAAVVFENSSSYPSFSNFSVLSNLAGMVNTANSFATLYESGFYFSASIEPVAC